MKNSTLFRLSRRFLRFLRSWYRLASEHAHSVIRTKGTAHVFPEWSAIEQDSLASLETEFNAELLRRRAIESESQSNKIAVGIQQARAEVPCDQTALPGDLWVISSYFNPIRSKMRYHNFLRFCEGMKRYRVKLLVVELGFETQPFVVGPDLADIVVQRRSCSLLWHKERLLNIALESLPASCDKVAWIDADILFADVDWAERASKLLEHYKILQLFSFIAHCPRDSSSCFPIRSIEQLEVHPSAVMVQQGLGMPITSRFSTFKVPHPGFAWAGRRAVLDQIGFCERDIIGSGDNLMYEIFTGDRSAEHAGLFPPKFRTWLGDYERKVTETVEGSTSFLPGLIYHLWHGTIERRQYRSKHEILLTHDFDPLHDITASAEGVWEWSSSKTGLHRDLQQYFKARRDDYL